MPPAARVLYAPPTDDERFLPEGPRRVAVGGADCLVWVTIQTAPGDRATGLIHVAPWPVTPGTVRSVPVPGRVGFVLPTDRPGVVVAGLENAIEVWDLARGERVEALATLPDPHPETVLNDAEVVPGGAGLVCGSKHTRFSDPVAALYLVTAADRQVTRLAGGQTISNGKVLTATTHGLTLYDIDTPRHVVMQYKLDLAARTLLEGGVAVDLRGRPGSPDGMVALGDGTAVIAVYSGTPGDGVALRVDLAAGTVVGEWAVPGSPRVTCPLVWGHPDGTASLVLTTAVEGMPDADRARCPGAGSLFVADLGPLAVPPVEVVRL